MSQHIGKCKQWKNKQLDVKESTKHEQITSNISGLIKYLSRTGMEIQNKTLINNIKRKL